MPIYVTASQLKKSDTIIRGGVQWVVDSSEQNRNTGMYTVELSNDLEFTKIYLLPASPVIRVSVGSIGNTIHQHLSLADSAISSIMDLASLAGSAEETKEKSRLAYLLLASLGYSFDGEWKKP